MAPGNSSGTGDAARNSSVHVGAWWHRLLDLRWRTRRRLRLCEQLPLGDRRFVAVIEFERSRFLIGGTSASLVLLARLEPGAIGQKGSPDGYTAHLENTPC